MAPELFENHNYTNKVDVYAYGILLWEMVSGSYPFKGQSPVQIAYAVCKLHERPEIPHRAPLSVRTLMKECWAHDPNRRPSFKQVYKRFASGEVKFSDTDDSAVAAMVQTLLDDKANCDSPPLPTSASADGPRHFLPTDMRGDKSLLQIIAPIADLSPIKDCSSPNFVEHLERIRRILNPAHAESFFAVVLPHLKKKLPVAVQRSILQATSDFVSANQHCLQIILEMDILSVLPLDGPDVIDPAFGILQSLFSQAPLSISALLFVALSGWLRLRPLYVLRLINIYTCLHPPLPLFWTAADILITQANIFQAPALLETYLRLLFTLTRIVEMFRTACFKYIVTILFRVIATTTGDVLKVTFDVLASVMTKSPTPDMQIDISLLLPGLRDASLTNAALSVLVRMPQQQPTYEVVLELLSIARGSELSCLLLCQYCDIEMVAVKMAEISSHWIHLGLPTVEHTLRLLLVIMCHRRSRQYLLQGPAVQRFLVGCLELHRPEIVDVVGSIQMAFSLNADFLNKLSQVQFLRRYIEVSCSANNSIAMLRCFELVKTLAKVGFSEDYLRMLPTIKGALESQAGGWNTLALSLLTTLSRHVDIRKAIVEQKLLELVAEMESTDQTVNKQKAKLQRNMKI
jgi:hypothetical protein